MTCAAQVQSELLRVAALLDGGQQTSAAMAVVAAAVTEDKLTKQFSQQLQLLSQCVEQVERARGSGSTAVVAHPIAAIALSGVID